MGNLTIEKIESGNYISQHRNKLLTEFFYLTGDIEKYGTGFLRVKKWFLDYPKLKYSLKDLSGFMQLVIKTVDDEKTDVPLNVSLNNRQNEIIKDISLNKNIMIIELANKYKLTEKTIKRDLQYLQEKNLIKRIGSKKIGFWEVLNE